MTRARTTNILEMAGDIVEALSTIRTALPAAEQESEAMATLETFVAVALRVIAKTNPSKVRDVARAVEIQALIPPFTQEKTA